MKYKKYIISAVVAVFVALVSFIIYAFYKVETAIGYAKINNAINFAYLSLVNDVKNGERNTFVVYCPELDLTILCFRNKSSYKELKLQKTLTKCGRVYMSFQTPLGEFSYGLLPWTYNIANAESNDESIFECVSLFIADFDLGSMIRLNLATATPNELEAYFVNNKRGEELKTINKKLPIMIVHLNILEKQIIKSDFKDLMRDTRKNIKLITDTSQKVLKESANKKEFAEAFFDKYNITLYNDIKYMSPSTITLQ